MVACQCGRILVKDEKRHMTVCVMSDSAHPQALFGADVFNCPGCMIEVYKYPLSAYMMVDRDEEFQREYEKLRMSDTDELVEVYK